MNEKNQNPINLLTEALANMTLCAMEAERERDDAIARGDEWYKHYQTKDANLKETQTMLAKEIQAHKKTKMELEEAIAIIEKMSIPTKPGGDLTQPTLAPAT